MPYPVGITTRAVTMGGATALESAEPLILQAVIQSSRGLIWGASGWRFPSLARTVTSTAGAEITVELPVTDLPGWRLIDAEGSILDVSVPGSYTHTYTVTLIALTAANKIVSQRILGPFVLPTGDGSPVDLDTLLPVGTQAGGAVLVPDTWSARLDALEAGGGTGGVVGVTADDTPAAPAEGESASYLVSSAVTWPAGLVWSTDPDGGVPPTITGTALVSMFTVGGITRAIMGATFPAPPAPADTTAPSIPAGLSATAASSTSVNLAWSASTDDTAVTGYEYRVGGGTAVDAGAGLTETVTGLTASTLYSFEVRAYDAAGNRSGWSTAASATTSAPPADSTPPTVGTMAATSITETGFTLTVSGASDAVALHATPYAFTTNGGSTWSAYQSSPVYVASGLTAATGYSCNWRVRDAAGNVSTGTAQTVTTGAAMPVPWIIDSFTGAAADVTTHTSDSGGTWTKLGPGSLALTGDGAAVPDALPATYIHSATPPSADYSVSLEMTASGNNNIGPAMRGYGGVYTERLALVGDGSKLYLIGQGGNVMMNKPYVSGTTYRLTVGCVGSNAYGKVQRLSDSMWLTPAGGWQSGEIPCLASATVVGSLNTAGKAQIVFGTAAGGVVDNFSAVTL